jgi:mercuric ion transport protein
MVIERAAIMVLTPYLSTVRECAASLVERKARMKPPAAENASIVAGVVAALGASSCCVLPLVLVSIGLGGAWVAQLRAMERFFTLFVGVAIVAFAYAFYRLYLRPVPCAMDTACDEPGRRRHQRVAFWVALIGAKALIVSPYVYAALAR